MKSSKMRHNPLTVLALSVYAESVEIQRAVSGLRRNAGRRFLVLGHNAPECSPHREAGTVLCNRNSTRAILLPENVEKQRRCLMASDDHPVDVLEPAKCKIAFLADMFVNQDSDEFQFSISGAAGLYFILRDIEDEIIEAQRLMDHYKEVKT